MSADTQRIKTLEDELVAVIGERDTAQAAVRRLSNYESAFEGLRGVVNVQYNAINALTDDRNEARLERDHYKQVAQGLVNIEVERDEVRARLRKANCDYGEGWLSCVSQGTRRRQSTG